jgi:hypothetical protein
MAIIENLALEKKILDKYYKSLSKNGLELTEVEQREVFRLVHRHYIKHSKVYDLYVSSTDPFKFVAWATLFIIQEVKKDSEQKEWYIGTAVSLMLKMLNECGKTLQMQYLKKLIDMTLNDKNSANDNLAIGKNGLYMAFRSASEVQCIDISSTNHKFQGSAN